MSEVSAIANIKPANILVVEKKYYLSDFGLVDYPDKEELTGKGERIWS